MIRFMLAAALSAGAITAASAQTGGNVNQGLNSDNGALGGPTIDRVSGINANGTPRQTLPGASMTNGAGNSTMTPSVSGATPTVHGTAPLTGIATPTINGKPVPPTQ